VLGNDSDPDGEPLTAALVTGPTSGNLTFNADGSFVYTPAPDFYGVVTFTYRANDGSLNSTPATVTINVTPVNDPPIAADDRYLVLEDTPLTVAAPGVLANDTDADDDELTAVLDIAPASGVLAFDEDGSFVYTPTLQYNGAVTFTYHVNDGTANSNAATVTIIVRASNDPPAAADDEYTTAEDTPLTIPAPGVLGQRQRPGRRPADSGAGSLSPASGALTFNADGSFVYTPSAGLPAAWPPSPTAPATVSLNSNIATVTINVTPVNDPPDSRGRQNTCHC
jgi:VCBS repeat-containing protein